MKPYRVLIADDEPPARRKLGALLAEAPDFELAGEAADGDQAVELLASQPFELLLLDVQMPGKDGLEVVRSVEPARLPAVVFVTAFDRHALRAFELAALDYLLKPFDRARFEAMLARARAEIGERRRGALAERLERLLAGLARARGESESLVLRNGRRTWIVSPAEIAWIEAADNYSRLHCAQEERLVRETLGALERRLAVHGFLRIHRSLLVNPRAVREVRPRRGGELELVLVDGTVLVSGRLFRKAVAERWPRATER